MTHAEPTLTIIIPAYNMENHVERAVTSCLGTPGVEILVIDDGSTDSTAAVVARLARAHHAVRLITQVNAGHGGAVNRGVQEARGRYLRVVDADDWLDPHSLAALVAALDSTNADVAVTNYVYEKVGKRTTYTVRYTNVFPTGRVCTWQDAGRFKGNQYLMMHALTYRTDLVHASGLTLPEHTFYVDYLFASIPLAHTRSILYLDVPLYHYLIGRDNQSVAEQSMIARIDQLELVNSLMVRTMPRLDDLPSHLFRYLINYVRVNFTITEAIHTLANRDNPQIGHAARAEMWRRVDDVRPDIAPYIRAGLLGWAIRLPGRAGDIALLTGYRIVQKIMGVN